VTNVARLLRGLLPVLAVSAAATAAVLPASAALLPVTTHQASTRAGEWWLTALRVPAALRAAPTAGKGVTVAVLSTGVDASHPDLTGTVTEGPDFSKTGRAPGSTYWGAEGTAVASLIAGHGHGPGGSDGVTGVAPAARILSLQVTLEYDDPLTSDATVTRRLPAAIAAGIRYAVGHGATVIALPLDPGTLGSATAENPAAGGSAAERSAVSFALAHGVLLVAPAGDNGAGLNSVNYPVAYPGVIAVGATAQDGKLAPFSSTRSYVTLTAPGSGTTPDPAVSGMMTDPAAGLMVAAPDGGYEPLASSDMSAALTAGVAALIRSRYPWLTVAEVTAALERGATAPPSGAGRGHGELNAGAALSAATAIAAAHPAPAPSTTPATGPATGPVVRPAGTAAAHQAAAGQSDPGRLLRSFVVDLAIAAGVLIVGLIGAIALTRLRRARAAGSGGTGAAGRPGHIAIHARHARGQLSPPTSPVPARVVIWPSTPTLPAVSRGVGDADWLSTMANDSPQAPGALGRSSGFYRRQQPAGHPPWQPALPPRKAGEPPLMLPAATAPTDDQPLPPWVRSPNDQPRPPWERSPDDKPLPPWERSPDDFATAPPTDDLVPWPVSSTGPMYVWNPAATTGPLSAITDDDEE
jgi:subtilisin family serine protease